MSDKSRRRWRLAAMAFCGFVLPILLLQYCNNVYGEYVTEQVAYVGIIITGACSAYCGIRCLQLKKLLAKMEEEERNKFRRG